jgi:tRNA1(Val) A37 N6-methylase TrmN6
MDRSVIVSATAGDAQTDDAFLGGALNILQPETGYRAGLDAVMLAAAVGTEDALDLLDVGAGVGTAGLCVARRIPSTRVTLFEKEPALVRLARENVQRNGLGDRVRVLEGDVGLSAESAQGIGLEAESFRCVIANPPFHDLGAGSLSADHLKAVAHAMPEGSLERWVRFMARMAAPGGSVALIHKAEALPRLLEALDGRFGGLQVLPLHPNASAPAQRVIVMGRKGSRAPLALLPGFVVHGADGAFTPQAQAILREGNALFPR